MISDEQLYKIVCYSTKYNDLYDRKFLLEHTSYTNSNKQHHRDEGPAIIIKNASEDSEFYNLSLLEKWVQNDIVIKELRREPNYNHFQVTENNNNITTLSYYLNGKLATQRTYDMKIGRMHSFIKPAYIEFNENGEPIMEKWVINGKHIGYELFDSWPLTVDQQLELKLKYG